MKAIAEAPAKVIITGEHFVVHGAWGLAAAVPKLVRAQVSPSSKFMVVSDRYPRSDSAELRPAAAVVEYLAREYSVDPRVKVAISSGVPKGAGLGSSASTLVSVAAAFSRLRKVRLGIDEVVRAAMVGEGMVHGHPSGIDPNICARGGVILFRPGSPPRTVALQGSRTIIVSYSGSTRSTRRQISRVGNIREGYPAYFSRLASSVGALSLDAAQMLGKGDTLGLGTVLNLNQAVLSSMGVSTDQIDEMVELSVNSGAYGAKLTAAGGGGSIIAVGPEAKEKSIVSGLKARGFETFSARVPVEGVRSWLSQ